MKIFLLDKDADVLLPDTSLTPKGMPVFLPDFCREGWELRSVVAYRIGRLGKCIGERFAWRYVDGVTLGALLMPAGGERYGSVLRYGFDSSLTLGDFQEITEGSAVECDFGWERFTADTGVVAREVSRVSRSCTVRTGDILIPGLGPAAVAAAIGTRVEMSLNGSELRPVRVK